MFLVCYFLRPCSITDPAVAKAVALFSTLALFLSFSFALIHTRSSTFCSHSYAEAFIFSTILQSEREIDDQKSFSGSLKLDLHFATRHILFVKFKLGTELFGEATISKGDFEFFFAYILRRT